ncbi:MAG TPA: hypothetical protein VG713_10010 [Pirellulales bacterium]|nr:hypothetical protein [Pirellulales bacterium]
MQKRSGQMLEIRGPDTGIYQRASTKPVTDPVEMSKAIQAWIANNNAENDIDAQMALFERGATDQAEHPENYLPRRASTELLAEFKRDANTLLVEIAGLRRQRAAGALDYAIRHAIEVGRILERLSVRRHEPATAREKKRARGHKYRFSKDKADKMQQAKESYVKLRIATPAAKKETLVRQVAEELACSERACWDYLKGVK